MSLSTKAMKASLSISSWLPFKKDVAVTKKAHIDFQASSNSGQFNKRLVDKAGTDGIKKVVNAARTYHYRMTLPWDDGGYRLLPSKLYLEYTQEMRRLKTEFNVSVAQFINDYPNLKLKAQQSLGTMFNLNEYPSVMDIREKFGFEIDIIPVETAGDFRAELSQQEKDKIKASIEKKSSERQANAMGDLWNRLYTCVSKMAEKLNDENATFRDSLVGNVIGLVDLLPDMNITDDADLAALTEEVRNQLCNVTAAELRSNKVVRKDIGSAAQSLVDAMDTMSGYMKAAA